MPAILSGLSGFRPGFSAPILRASVRAEILQDPAEFSEALEPFHCHVSPLPDRGGEIRPVADARGPRHRAGLPRLTAIDGVTCQLAEGAFYLFPNISSFGISSLEFCDRLLEKEKVALVPGSAFGAEGYARLSYATSDEIIKKGLERLARFCATLR